MVCFPYSSSKPRLPAEPERRLRLFVRVIVIALLALSFGGVVVMHWRAGHSGEGGADSGSGGGPRTEALEVGGGGEAAEARAGGADADGGPRAGSRPRDQASGHPGEAGPSRGAEVVSRTASTDSGADDAPGADKTAAGILAQSMDLSDPRRRAEVVARLRALDEAREREIEAKARRLGVPVSGRREDGTEFVLRGFEGDDPLYEQTENVNAAISTAAHLVRETEPFDADGSGELVGLWEVNLPRHTHREFGSRLALGEGSSGSSDHATHVAGTLIAAGVNAALKGMAPAAEAVAHTSSGDSTEMTALGASYPGEAGKIYVSNHSYGYGRGWEANNVWEGEFSDNGDSSDDIEEEFGRYSSWSRTMDGVASNLPYYLPFFSGGNHRNDGPPSIGETWYEGSVSGPSHAYDPAGHPAGDGDYKNGYDTCEGKKVAKNVMTVGAVSDAVSGGSRYPGGASLLSFSSTGPTDDGRIKPDIVANGSSLQSAGGGSDTDTAWKSGTSMASPNAAGSAMLLVDYYGRRFPGQAMRAATLKGLIIHTADDLGNPGPDYRFGWGLMNTKAAAALIKDHADSGGGLIIEDRVTTALGSASWSFSSDGAGPLRVTLSWTDPAGDEISGHDNRSRALVNDLNLSVSGPGGTRLPWVMPHVGDWSLDTLDDPATTGVNTVDNVEQVFLASPAAGAYTVTVDYAGALANGLQDFSVIVSGLATEALVAEPAGLPEWEGPAGGSFDPAAATCTLSNFGATNAEWAADAPDWLDVSPGSGTLAPGTSMEVTVSPGAAAGDLEAGEYPASVRFDNLDTGGNTAVAVALKAWKRVAPPFKEDFEAPLESCWEVSGTGDYRTVPSTANSPYAGTRHLLMDSAVDGRHARNELTLTIDLAGAEGVELSFWAREFSDEQDAPPGAPFTGGADFDGLAVSTDGEQWFPIHGFPTAFSSYMRFSVDLDAAFAARGLTYNDRVRIRFNHYDNYGIPTDGFAIDEIEVIEAGTPEIVVEGPDQSLLLDGGEGLDFDSVLLGASGGPLNLTIRNVGTADLTELALSRSGPHPAEFAVTGPAETTLAPGASTGFTVTFAPGETGPRSAVVQVVSNDPDENPFDIPVRGIGLHTLQTWREAYFGTTENEGDAADSSDPNKDGVSNLLAFATGRHPLLPGPPPLELRVAGGQLEATHARSRAALAEGIGFVIEWNDTLEGPWSAGGVADHVLSDDGVLQVVESTLPRGAKDLRFVRLRVNRE